MKYVVQVLLKTGDEDKRGNFGAVGDKGNLEAVGDKGNFEAAGGKGGFDAGGEKDPFFELRHCTDECLGMAMARGVGKLPRGKTQAALALLHGLQQVDE